MKKVATFFITVILISTSYSSMTISDGDYYSYVEIFTGTVVMTGGTVAKNLYVKQGSFGEIYGGYIGNFLVVDQTSQVWMYGGHVISGISSPNEGKFNWYGGIIDGQIRAGWRNQLESPSSHHAIYGSNFKLNGVPVNNIILNAENGYVDPEDSSPSYLMQSYWLTGILTDGIQINNELIIHGDSTIELVVVPEPTTLLLLGMGGLAFRIRRYQ